VDTVVAQAEAEAEAVDAVVDAAADTTTTTTRIKAAVEEATVAARAEDEAEAAADSMGMLELWRRKYAVAFAIEGDSNEKDDNNKIEIWAVNRLISAFM
jgi:K+/H+ antiporter YhaU regulatory subunit KhtT